MTPFFTVLWTCLIIMIIVASVSVSLVFAQTSDFQTGYSDGKTQGISDRNSHIFRIGNSCENQNNSYCNGYLSGYLDGFFSTLPLSTHTTTIIHESHKERGGCHADNCTKPSTPIKPIPTPPPTPPKGNGT